MTATAATETILDAARERAIEVREYADDLAYPAEYRAECLAAAAAVDAGDRHTIRLLAIERAETLLARAVDLDIDATGRDHMLSEVLALDLALAN